MTSLDIRKFRNHPRPREVDAPRGCWHPQRWICGFRKIVIQTHGGNRNLLMSNDVIAPSKLPFRHRSPLPRPRDCQQLPAHRPVPILKACSSRSTPFRPPFHHSSPWDAFCVPPARGELRRGARACVPVDLRTNRTGKEGVYCVGDAACAALIPPAGVTVLMVGEFAYKAGLG